MKTKITLIADEGMILTDGVHYGRIVYLTPEADASAYHEIPAEEYEAILDEEAMLDEEVMIDEEAMLADLSGGESNEV